MVTRRMRKPRVTGKLSEPLGSTPNTTSKGLWSPPASRAKGVNVDISDKCEEEGDRLAAYHIRQDSRTTKHETKPITFRKCPQKVGSPDGEFSSILLANYELDTAFLRAARQDEHDETLEALFFSG